MIWIISIAFFVVGVFSGLVLFAWLEKELITKMLLLKAEVLHCIKEECKNLKLTTTNKKRR